MARAATTAERGHSEIECLACGACRSVAGFGALEIGECLSCGYLGWAPPAELSDRERKKLHASRIAVPHVAPRATDPEGIALDEPVSPRSGARGQPARGARAGHRDRGEGG